MRYIITILIAAAFVLLVYLLCENFILLTVRHAGTGKRLRIAHISDIHKKRYQGDNMLIVYRIEQEEPDLIFITGDIVSRTETDFSVTEAFLRELCKIAPVYMIFGNHEQSLPAGRQEEFLQMLARTDVILLRNSRAEASVNGKVFNICGIEPPYTTYKKNGGYFHLDKVTAEDMRDMVGDPTGETLLLAHNPIFAEAYAEWGADYTFSGHVHGGAVRLFGIGMLSPERRFFPKYTKGEYDIGGKKLFVSAGIGKLRAFDPPEIVIYDI